MWSVIKNKIEHHFGRKQLKNLLKSLPHLITFMDSVKSFRKSKRCILYGCIINDTLLCFLVKLLIV